MIPSPSVERVLALNGRDFASLTADESLSLEFYRAGTRKDRIVVDIVSETLNPIVLSGMTRKDADNRLRAVQSTVKVFQLPESRSVPSLAPEFIQVVGNSFVFHYQDGDRRWELPLGEHYDAWAIVTRCFMPVDKHSASSMAALRKLGVLELNSHGGILEPVVQSELGSRLWQAMAETSGATQNSMHRFK